MKKALKFKIALREFKPTIYRHLAISPDINFEDFHEEIQTVFGFFDYHMRDFRKGQEFTIKKKNEYCDDDFDLTTLNPKKTKLKDIFTTKNIKKLVYTYDYGDSWEFDIEFLGEIETDKELPYLLKSKGGILLEDCGGVRGLSDLIEIYNKKDKKGAEEMGYDDWKEFEETMEDVVQEINIDDRNAEM